MFGDPARLGQVLLNLLGNAIKFTAAGAVVLRVVREEGCAEKGEGPRVCFSVQDTGIGLSAVAKAKLFQPFTQADGSTARRFGGTGLGLSISKRLVELMGGEIGVDSTEGRGSTFWFKVPLVAAPASDQPVPSAAVPAEHSLRGRRVLVADDHLAATEILGRYLRGWGADVASVGRAADGAGGIAALRPRGVPLRSGDPRQTHARSRRPGTRRGKSVPTPRSPRCRWCWRPPSTGGRCGRTRSPRVARPTCANLCAGRNSTKSSPDYSPTFAPAGPCNATAKSLLPGAGQRPAVRDEHILVAEDNVVNQRVLLSQLRSLGYQAQAVANGHEALEAMAHGSFALVLMDCHMPEMDGLEATRIIRAQEAKTAHARVGESPARACAGVDGRRAA